MGYKGDIIPLDESRKAKCKYKIGEIVGGYKILEQIVYKDTYSYLCECVKCHRLFKLTQSGVTHKSCNCDRYLFKNKYPQLINMLSNPNDQETYSFTVHDTYNFKCPICGYIKEYPVSRLLYSNFSCDMCNDNISYPEKFIASMLVQLNQNFIKQLSKSKYSWCKNYFYDFYIEKYNCIIETHGMQHYENRYTSCFFSNNDIEKENLAKENNILNYIILDCRQSNMKFIKESVMSSSLPTLLYFTENDVDWNKCHTDACSSLIKQASEMYNNTMSITEISKRLKLSIRTIEKYLVKGSVAGLCNYEVYEEKDVAVLLHKLKPFVCINTGDTFFDVLDCVEKSESLFGQKLSKSAINRVLKGEYSNIKGFSFKFIDKAEYMNTYLLQVVAELRRRKAS